MLRDWDSQIWVTKRLLTCLNTRKYLKNTQLNVSRLRRFGSMLQIMVKKRIKLHFELMNFYQDCWLWNEWRPILQPGGRLCSYYLDPSSWNFEGLCEGCSCRILTRQHRNCVHASGMGGNPKRTHPGLVGQPAPSRYILRPTFLLP